jgi:opacity protein-like surface antigen
MKVMRALILVTTILVAALAFSQETPKAEIFGGYSAKVQEGMDVASGWEGSATGNVNRWLGVTADVSGYYRTDDGVSQRNYNFLFGPRVTYRTEKLSPFGQVLFGVAHERVGNDSANITDNAFAMVVGGGLDYNLKKHLAVRLLQADYLRTRFGGASQNNARLTFGVVLKLGNK